ncbi:hypothetical protein [Rhizorhabdus sp. FW153]|uniref:hypothetical protein n=1 Tax=Rhizorhabdus sp. FW153 TaxID=3400216 RepID=UPI003CF517D6
MALRHFLLLALLSLAVGSLANLYFRLGADRPLVGPWLLKQFYVNYVDFGFAKRALVGTLLYPVFSAPVVDAATGAAIATGLSLAIFAVMILLLDRLHARPLRREEAGLGACVLAALLLSPAGLMEIAHDIGRYDALNIALLLVAVALVLNGRPRLAGLIFGIAGLVHEAVFFYGVGPLAVALFATRSRPADMVACLLPGALALGAVGLWGNLDAAQLALLDARPGSGTTVWSRGVIEVPIALKPYEQAALAFYTLAPFVLLFAVLRHNRASLLRYFLPPTATLLLFPLGFDYFRWASLGLFAVALTLLIGVARLGWRLPPASPALTAIFLLYCLPLGPLGTAHPLPFLELIWLHFTGWGG